MRPWLVTGAAGQLGRSLIEVGARERLVLHGRDLELDVTDESAVEHALRELRPEVVINAAAFTQVDLCEERRDEAHRVNAVAPGVLARACSGSSTLLVHVSTDYVFAGDGSTPIPEDARCEPRSVYGKTKAVGEAAVRDVGGEHLIVRTQWLFGPGPNFVRTILNAAAKGEPLRVVEDQVGRPTGSAELAVGLVQAIRSGLRGTLHLACDGVTTWYDFARAIVIEGASRKLTRQVDVEACATAALGRPAPRPAYGVLGLERARSAGLRLPHWTQALSAYLDAEVSRRG